MGPSRLITPQEWEFFSTVARTAFANPFSDERVRLDQVITGITRSDLTREEMVQLVTGKISDGLRAMEESGRGNINLFEGEERRTIGVVFLFTVYHWVRPYLDDFIQKQLSAGEVSCKVPFGREVLKRLVRLGFTEQEALKYFGFFYQFRRAFYFTESALVGVQFRDDFYYRLCSDTIRVPSLRERIQEDPRELEVMVQHILTRMLGEARPNVVELVLVTVRKELPPEYPWPGNVRELEQAIRSILISGGYRGDSCRQAEQGREEGVIDAHTLLAQHCRRLFERFGTFEEVARLTHLDRRTVKKYLDARKSPRGNGDG